MLAYFVASAIRGPDGDWRSKNVGGDEAKAAKRLFTAPIRWLAGYKKGKGFTTHSPDYALELLAATSAADLLRLKAWIGLNKHYMLHVSSALDHLAKRNPEAAKFYGTLRQKGLLHCAIGIVTP
jgi:hypothetical protein